MSGDEHVGSPLRDDVPADCSSVLGCVSGEEARCSLSYLSHVKDSELLTVDSCELSSVGCVGVSSGVPPTV